MYKTMNIYLAIMFTCLLCHVCKAEMPQESKDTGGYFFPYPEKCSDILKSFANAASNFTLCSIENARPIRLCKKCVQQYIDFSDHYKQLSETVVNGTSCKAIFESRDRLNAILEYHDNILAIWTKGNCYECFDWSGKVPNLSNNTKKFIQMYNETTECIVNNFNSTSNDSKVICEKCMQSYLQLDKFYKSLSADSIGLESICMDVVDSMNATRSVWSKTLNCCKLRRTPEIIFLCCTGIISVLPLLFYLSLRYCGPIRDLPNVLKQSRFKQTFLRTPSQRSN